MKSDPWGVFFLSQEKPRINKSHFGVLFNIIIEQTEF